MQLTLFKNINCWWNENKFLEKDNEIVQKSNKHKIKSNNNKYIIVVIR